MFFAVLSACLAGEVPACGPVTLAGQPFSSMEQCTTGAPRIAGTWLAAHPDLTRGGLSCVPLSDLPVLPVREVAPGVHVHLGQIAQFEDSPDGWIANLGFVVGSDSIAVIDAGASRAQGQALFAAIRAVSDKPISHLVVTHMHPDHAFGAEVFREAGATIVGHARLADALQSRGPVYLDNLTRLYGSGPMIGTRVVLPDVAVGDSLDIDLGGRVLTLTATGPAHSDNDLTVLDRATGTLFAGDLVFRGLTPIVDGSLPGWIGWMDGARDGGPVVPGHGPVARDWSEAVGAQRDFLTALDHATRDALDAGLPLSQAVPAIVEALQPLAGDWASFPDSVARDATAAFKELEWE
ncbi:quinoprotein relay system zinc metallohydrolase 2 [Paracoccus sp. YIM 132242]|uniref:Quinoprotein relay system zinc metallohydrolase 2 n=1 Tax=Paracoccus lichenicola TaxID=2665644 RepID=A0A6L6HPW5_9RHOB|nr:quinoprotein relay system zinc metallohydrolase 2 [Paracoccus lichenicola]MTE00330.1 quinoprotein relay system zinc metallohydrolase 2 [Paracoccus lichenicola]